jgi:hypothetical protein
LELILRLVGGLVAEVGGELIGRTPGAAFTAVSSVALAYATEYDRKSAQQADEVLAEAQQSAGITAEDLASWARSDEHLRLLVGVIEAAWRTRNRDKRKALCRVLAEGIKDEALIDVSNLLAEAFRDIEAPHLRLLEHMAQRPPDDTRAWGPEDLAEQLPGLADGVAPLLASLQRAGCILAASGFGGGVWFVVTDFGRLLLAYVRRGDPSLPAWVRRNLLQC